MASLVDKSLLQQNEPASSEPRFGMLETIREYGLECLAASGEAHALRKQHAEFFLAQAEHREADAIATLERLEREHDNLRAALAWCQEDASGGPMGLRIAGALGRFWDMHGHWNEGGRWLAGALAHPGAAVRTAARGKALFQAGHLAAYHGDDLEAARSLYEEGLAIAREVGDPLLPGDSLRCLGDIARRQGDLETAWRRGEESVAADREAGHNGGIAAGLAMLGLFAHGQGENGKARALLDESLALLRELGNITCLWPVLGRIDLALEEGDSVIARSLAEEALVHSRELGYRSATAQMLRALGTLATNEGNYVAAKLFWEESLTLHWELGERRSIPRDLEDLTALAAAGGEPERVARLWGAAAALREACGYRWPDDVERADDERRLATARAALGDAAFEAAWASGQRLSLEDAVEYALQEGTNT